MSSNEQGIVKMLQDKIKESEEKIKSFRQAISALSGGGSAAVASAKPGKRRGRKPGSKNKAKASAKAAPVKAVAAKPKRRRRRKSKAGRPKATAVKAVTAKVAKPKAAKPKAAKKGRKPRSGETMEGWVLKQFEDNTPKTARNLMERYNKDTGKKLEMNGFSARLAIIKKKGNVKSMKNAADGLSYNGRSEWFENGKLKKEYLPKG